MQTFPTMAIANSFDLGTAHQVQPQILSCVPAERVQVFTAAGLEGNLKSWSYTSQEPFTLLDGLPKSSLLIELPVDCGGLVVQQTPYVFWKHSSAAQAHHCCCQMAHTLTYPGHTQVAVIDLHRGL